MYTKEPLSPFGLLVVSANKGARLQDIPIEDVVSMVGENHLVVLRGYGAVEDEELKEYARSFGPLLEWDFGEVFKLQVNHNPANHLFRTGRVEMHWDGAYLEEVPRYSLFHCIESAGSSGGETIFTDTSLLLKKSTSADLENWRKVRVTYSTEKKAHYGGHVTVPLVQTDKASGLPVIRFIEPDNEDNMDVHPVRVSVEDLAAEEQSKFLSDLVERIYRNDVMYRHEWRTGDYLIYDNNILLHGRNRLEGNIRRSLKRVHIMERNGSMENRRPRFIETATQDARA